MINKDFKKNKEFQSIQPLMKELGYDPLQAGNSLIPSEEPDFLLEIGGKNVGIEVTECHPEVTTGKGAKNVLAARQRTLEICKYIEKTQDAQGKVVNYRIGFNFVLLFDLQKPKLKRPEKEKIQNEVLSELQQRINNGDYINSGDDYQKLHIEWAKDYHYIRDVEVGEPLEKSIVTYSYPARGAKSIEHDIVFNAVAHKESRLCSYYRCHPEIKEFWLCVNIPMGVNRTLGGIQKLKVESLYDRIYLTTANECIRIK